MGFDLVFFRVLCGLDCDGGGFGDGVGVGELVWVGVVFFDFWCVF